MPIRRYIRAVRYGLTLSKAEDLLTRQSYTEAEEVMRSAYALMDHAGPTPSAPARANILSGVIAYRMGKPVAALEALTIAVSQLNQEDCKGSDGEVGYMKIYVRQLLEFCADRFKEDSNEFLNLAGMVEFPKNGTDTTHVRTALKKLFPLVSE